MHGQPGYYLQYSVVLPTNSGASFSNMLLRKDTFGYLDIPVDMNAWTWNLSPIASDEQPQKHLVQSF